MILGKCDLDKGVDEEVISKLRLEAGGRSSYPVSREDCLKQTERLLSRSHDFQAGKVVRVAEACCLGEGEEK